jgi:hypothetical protein
MCVSKRKLPISFNVTHNTGWSMTAKRNSAHPHAHTYAEQHTANDTLHAFGLYGGGIDGAHVVDRRAPMAVGFIEG